MAFNDPLFTMNFTPEPEDVANVLGKFLQVMFMIDIQNGKQHPIESTIVIQQVMFMICIPL